MNGLGDRLAARHKAIGAAAQVLVAMYALGSDETAAADLLEAETAFELAARDLVNAIDDLPPREWPKGWQTNPDRL